MSAHNVFPTRRAGKRVGWTFVSDPGDGQECPSYSYARPKTVSRNSVRWPSEAVGTVFSTASEGHRTVKTSSTANFGTRSTGRTRRAAFTLTELLVVIMVIGILASSVLFALYGAIQTAKEKRTKAQVTKLHDMLMTRWESYRTRPIRLLNLPAPARRNAKGMATARLYALRDLMRMEMPDRKTDVLDNPVPVYGPNVKIARPSLNRQYLRRAKAVYDSSNGRWTAPTWSVDYEDAECLYMIVASIRDVTSNGLDFVREGEIGDLDGDGMPEILDTWGQPFAFLRWPAGFVAHPGPDFNYGTADDIPSYSAIQPFTVDASNLVADEDRDPFDPLRCDNRPPIPMTSGGFAEYYFNYKLYPLVCSGGPDELLDIVRFDVYDHDGDGSDDPGDTPDAFTNYHYNRNVPPAPQINTGSNPNPDPHFDPSWPQNDPYAVMPGSNKRLGDPFRGSFGYVDNITNHWLGD